MTVKSSTTKHVNAEASVPVQPPHFPAWFYGPKAARKIVGSQQELDELGPGWFDSPDKAEAAEAKAEKQ